MGLAYKYLNFPFALAFKTIQILRTYQMLQFFPGFLVFCPFASSLLLFNPLEIVFSRYALETTLDSNGSYFASVFKIEAQKSGVLTK